MKNTLSLGALLVLPLALAGQVIQSDTSAVTMGHLHLTSADPEAQRRFWQDYLGGKPAKLGTLRVTVLPGVIVFIDRGEPTGGTAGSVVDHVGLKVRDLKAMLARADSLHFQTVTSNDRQAMLLAPDAIRVELTEDSGLAQPVVNHHIHFYVSSPEAARQWYASTFGAIPGMRGKFLAADLPGVNLSFSQAEHPLAPTKGRALDHIGFEVRNLEPFTKKLEAGGLRFEIAYRDIPEIGVKIAFLTDPDGARVELTEGLSRLP